MAFLCPSRLGYTNRAKRVKEKAPKPKGRITGSDSIDTIEEIGVDKRSYQTRVQKVEIIKDFDPKVPGETQVTKGDICCLIYTSKDWYYIEKANGQKGYVPRSVCCALTDIDTEVSLTNSISSSRLSEYSADLSENNTDVESVISRNMSPLFKPQQIKDDTSLDFEMEVVPFYKTSHGQYIVLFDFEGLNENDVSVERAELVEVLNIEDPDWSWIRKYDGLEGFVPKTYICPVEPLRKLVRNGGFIIKPEMREKQKMHSGTNALGSNDDGVSVSQSTSSNSHEICSTSLTSVSDYTFERKHKQSVQEHFSKNIASDFILSDIQKLSKAADDHEPEKNAFSSDIHHINRQSDKRDTNCLTQKHFEAKDGAEILQFDRAILKKYAMSSMRSSSGNVRSDDAVAKKFTDNVEADKQKSAFSSKSESGKMLDNYAVISNYTQPEGRNISQDSPDTKTEALPSDLETKQMKNDQSTNGQRNCFLKSGTVIGKSPTHKSPKQKCEHTSYGETAFDRKYNYDIKYNTFENVTDELASILKKRKQIVERASSATSHSTNISESTVSKGQSSVPHVRSGCKRSNQNMSNFIEYVMKYEYKGTPHGQQNIYVQKGEAIYADLNAQNSTEWIWVHIPRTNQYGYIPVSYAEEQSTVVL